MGTHGKKYNEAAKLVERGRAYGPDEAAALLRQTSVVAFDASVEAHIRLGVDPRHADQMVRGTVVLPHGTGKRVRAIVLILGQQRLRLGGCLGPVHGRFGFLHRRVYPGACLPLRNRRAQTHLRPG